METQVHPELISGAEICPSRGRLSNFEGGEKESSHVWGQVFVDRVVSGYSQTREANLTVKCACCGRLGFITIKTGDIKWSEQVLLLDAERG